MDTPIFTAIRTATAEDIARYEYSAARFLHRHAAELGIRTDAVADWYARWPDWIGARAYVLSEQHDNENPGTRPLKPLWRAAARRALRDRRADCICYGSIGYSTTSGPRRLA